LDLMGLGAKIAADIQICSNDLVLSWLCLLKRFYKIKFKLRKQGANTTEKTLDCTSA